LSIVDIITVVIGAVTVSLLFTLLVMMRTMYVLVRRDTVDTGASNTGASGPSDPMPNAVEP